MIYLDNAATTPPDPLVIEAIMPYLTERWQNPSSGYRASKHLSEELEGARAAVARLIGAEPEEIYFTSGGTEANNTVLHSITQLIPDASFLSSQVEHSALLRPLESLARRGHKVELLPVNQRGRVELEALTGKDPHFMSVMWANNETGTMQPLSELVTWARERGIPTHSDAIQAVGKIPLSVREIPVDMLSISGHKLHALKGVGAVYLRSGFRFSPLLLGGGQESGRRSGTENVAGIIALKTAAELALDRLSQDPGGQKVAAVRESFEHQVCKLIDGVTVNGDLQNRLPTHSHLSFDRCEAAGLMILLDEYGVQCSTGSACMTGKQEASHVQKAMGFSDAKANSSLRFSFSHLNTFTEATQAAEAVEKAVKKLRSVQSTGTGPVVIYNPDK